MKSQKQVILNLLIDREWVCTSDMYALYIADVRRRLVDLKQDGYILTSRKCEQHDYHAGGSKEWHIISPPQTRMDTRNDLHPLFDEILTKAQINPTEAFYKNLKQGSLLS